MRGCFYVFYRSFLVVDQRPVFAETRNPLSCVRLVCEQELGEWLLTSWLDWLLLAEWS